MSKNACLQGHFCEDVNCEYACFVRVGGLPPKESPSVISYERIIPQNPSKVNIKLELMFYFGSMHKNHMHFSAEYFGILLNVNKKQPCRRNQIHSRAESIFQKETCMLCVFGLLDCKIYDYTDNHADKCRANPAESHIK